MATEGETTPATETETTDPAPAEEVAPVETPTEGDPPAEGTETPAAATEAAPPTGAEVFAALPEAEQAAIAAKHANKTMAAARRAEARVEAVKTENTQLRGNLETYQQFVQQLRSGDPAALARVGFKSPREYLDAVVAFGGEKPAPSVEDRLNALDEELRTEKAARSKAEAEARVEQSKALVFKAVDASEKFDLVATDIGHENLWSAIEAYFDEHGECPDEAVWMLADEVEKDLAAKLAKSKKFNGQRQPAKNGDANGQAQPATLNPGKTLTSKGASGAPAVEELSNDPDIRRAQVNAQMRAAGEI